MKKIEFQRLSIGDQEYEHLLGKFYNPEAGEINFPTFTISERQKQIQSFIIRFLIKEGLTILTNQ